jgi:hypothetical protein
MRPRDFTLGGVSFSSSLAAFQTIALAWNIGHLPGTFGVEKGVHRFLMNRSRNNPTEFLQVAHRTDPKVVQFLRGADVVLAEEGFPWLCRILSVIKLLSLGQNVEDWAPRFAPGSQRENPQQPVTWRGDRSDACYNASIRNAAVERSGTLSLPLRSYERYLTNPRPRPCVQSTRLLRRSHLVRACRPRRCWVAPKHPA